MLFIIGVAILSFCGGVCLAMIISTAQAERDYKELAEFVREQTLKEVRAKEKRLIEQTNHHSIQRAKKGDYFNSF